MNKIIFLITAISLLSGCRKALKDVDDYYAECNTLTPVVNSDGTVEVIAEVIRAGYGQLEYIGFCMDTTPTPTMLQNQRVVTELTGSQFKATYTTRFNPSKTYYFRSWVANSAGYSYGNVVSLANIRATPVEAPCTLNENSSNIGLNGSGTGLSNSINEVSEVDHFSSTWDINCNGYNASAGRLKFRFGSELKTKIYTTTGGEPFGDKVLVHISSGFTSGIVNDGVKVYVNQKSEGVYEITICDAVWTVSGFNTTGRLNARFTSPL